MPDDHHRIRPALWPALLLTALLAATAGASTVVPMDVGDLTANARQVFHGTCVEVRADRVGDDIVTRLRFVVDESLKGAAGADTVDVAIPGGVLDGVRTTISGMPRFAAGDEVVLFLTGPDGAGRVWPVGLAQGEFRVHRGADAVPRVRRDLAGLHFPGSARPAAPVAGERDLQDLLAEIRAAVGAAPGRAPGESR